MIIMLVNAELYVRDLPGQLVGSIEPISMVDGNIVSVMHDRETMMNKRILVKVTFEVKDNSQIEKLKAIWKSRDIIICKMGSVYSTLSMDYMLLGSFTAAYVDSLIDVASRLANVESVDVSYSSQDKNSGKRTAMITLEVREREDLEKVDAFFAESCKRDSLIYIRGI